MKNIFIGLCLITLLSACSNQSYLPSTRNIGTNPYGARIVLFTQDRGLLDGELIAVQGQRLYFINDRNLQCDTISQTGVRTYKVQFAKQKIKGWLIPLATVAGVSFGRLSAIMLPVNIISSIALVSISKKASRYDQTEIRWEDLHQFARYPQGLPEGMRMVDVVPAGEAQ